MSSSVVARAQPVRCERTEDTGPARVLNDAASKVEAVGRVAIFLRRLSPGGAEHVMLTLARGFVARQYAVDLVLVTTDGGLLPRVPAGVRVIVLGAGRVTSSVPALVRYLRAERPSVMLSTLDSANAVGVLAATLARVRTPVVIRQAAHLSRTMEARSRVRAAVLPRLVRWSYRRADAVIAVSAGVADDLATRWGVCPERIQVLPNPIVSSEIAELASRPLDDPWFRAGSEPVVLGVGRLTRQKQFDVLIRAFAHVRRRHPARLVILGEGEERRNLERLIRELQLEQVVALPGFVENPFNYMANSKVFVLSSAWEGLPGALIQALACGTAVVATDCDSGPREILRGGKVGRLVPVGDIVGLGEAILTTLFEPTANIPEDVCRPYSESGGIEAYLTILRGSPA